MKILDSILPISEMHSDTPFMVWALGALKFWTTLYDPSFLVLGTPGCCTCFGKAVLYRALTILTSCGDNVDGPQVS